MSEQISVMDFCGKCSSDKFVSATGGCLAYSPEGQQRWLNFRGCRLGNVDLDKPKDTKKAKVNPLKASKRARK